MWTILKGELMGIVKINESYILIGEDVAIGEFGHITAHLEAPIAIGKNTVIGPFVMMNSNNHNYGYINKLIRDQGHTRLPISIGEDVWIGGRVSILYGSIIPNKCVIGANSLVTRHDVLERGGVYVGSPLKLITCRR